MTKLETKKCVPCEGGATPLSNEAARTLMNDVDNWSLENDGKEISCKFTFKNYYQTMAFVNSVAWIAHQEDHHPDMEVSYSTCLIHYSTHAIGGLSENDFICAAKINKLLSN